MHKNNGRPQVQLVLRFIASQEAEQTATVPYLHDLHLHVINASRCTSHDELEM